MSRTGTFLSPTVSKDALQARRNSPDAWDDGRVELSTGYVSDIDLYRVKLPVTLGDVMTKKMKMKIKEEEEEEEKGRRMENGYDGGCSDDYDDDDDETIRSIGMFNELLLQAAMMMMMTMGQSQLNSSQSDRKSDGSYSPNVEIPLFRSGNPVIDTSRLNKYGFISATKDGFISLQEGFMSIVQEPGDLILIPPGCWHQVSCR